METLARRDHPAAAAGVFDESRLGFFHFGDEDNCVFWHALEITVTRIVRVDRPAREWSQDWMVRQGDHVVRGAVAHHADTAWKRDAIALRAIEFEQERAVIGYIAVEAGGILSVVPIIIILPLCSGDDDEAVGR